MTEQQKIHIAMVNSFNVLTKRVSIEQIFNSDIPMFSHAIEDEPNFNNVMFIVKYFEKVEMFEECLLLKMYADETFDEDGNFIEELCECPYPKIIEYSFQTECKICNLKLKH